MSVLTQWGGKMLLVDIISNKYKREREKLRECATSHVQYHYFTSELTPQWGATQ